MSDRICLLRGVNVGGVKVPMAELKVIAVEAGFAHPRRTRRYTLTIPASCTGPADPCLASSDSAAMSRS